MIHFNPFHGCLLNAISLSLALSLYRLLTLCVFYGLLFSLALIGISIWINPHSNLPNALKWLCQKDIGWSMKWNKLRVMEATARVRERARKKRCCLLSDQNAFRNGSVSINIKYDSTLARCIAYLVAYTEYSQKDREHKRCLFYQRK